MARNKLYLAAAGAGKTTFLVNRTIDLMSDNDTKAIAFITFTTKNQNVIEQRIAKRLGFVPSKIRIVGWYAFLLEYCIRPFMGSVIDELYCTSTGVYMINGTSGKMVVKGKTITTYKADDLKKKYLTNGNLFYSDKLAEFSMECFKVNKQEFNQRIGNIFSYIFIDEVQDLSAWDYEILSQLVKNEKLTTILCGDLRQKTYSTNQCSKNKNYKGRVDLFFEEKVNKKGKRYIDIDYNTLNKSHRFGLEIADFASRIFGNAFPTTRPCTCPNCIKKRSEYTDNVGVYLVARSNVNSFVKRYNPLVLIWDKRHDEKVSNKTVNYGESKGMEDNVTLIYPTAKIVSAFLSSHKSNAKIEDGTRCKFYVAVTRARHLCGIVVDDYFNNQGIGLEYWTLPLELSRR